MNRRDLIRACFLALVAPAVPMLEDEDTRARRILNETWVAVGWQTGTGKVVPRDVLVRAVRHGGREFTLSLARFMASPVRRNPWTARA